MITLLSDVAAAITAIGALVWSIIDGNTHPSEWLSAEQTSLWMEREAGLVFYGVRLLPGYWPRHSVMHRGRHDYVSVYGDEKDTRPVTMEIGRDNEAPEVMIKCLRDLGRF